VSDFPQQDEARISLFRAAASLRSDEVALAVLEPLLRTQFLGIPPPASADVEKQQIIDSGNDNSGNDEEEQSYDPDYTPASTPKLPLAKQAEVAQMIGDTMNRLGRLSDAVAYYESARRMESAPAVRKTLLHKIAEAKTVLRIQQRNTARQPRLHEPLEQDRAVRPQLLARGSPARKAPAAQGGVKP
jgi:hypothetical protein